MEEEDDDFYGGAAAGFQDADPIDYPSGEAKDERMGSDADLEEEEEESDDVRLTFAPMSRSHIDMEHIGCAIHARKA